MEFHGKYKLVRSEHFEEFLKEMGKFQESNKIQFTMNFRRVGQKYTKKLQRILLKRRNSSKDINYLILNFAFKN